MHTIPFGYPCLTLRNDWQKFHSKWNVCISLTLSLCICVYCSIFLWAPFAFNYACECACAYDSPSFCTENVMHMFFFVFVLSSSSSASSPCVAAYSSSSYSGFPNACFCLPSDTTYIQNNTPKKKHTKFYDVGLKHMYYSVYILP